MIEVVLDQIKQCKCSTQESTQGHILMTNIFIKRFSMQKKGGGGRWQIEHKIQIVVNGLMKQR